MSLLDRFPMQGIIAKTKTDATKPRYKEWKCKMAKLKSLRKKLKDTQMSQNPSDGIVLGSFVPSGHGFNFMPSVYKEMLKCDAEVDLDDSEKSKKRKFFEELSEEQNKTALAWHTMYLSENARLESKCKESFKRSIVRATATKNVDLLRELLEEKAKDPNNLLSAPASRLFPTFPSQKEKYREELNYALLIALCSNSCEMVKMLLGAGASVSHFNEWYPLVLNAVEKNNVDLVKVLMAYGSDASAARHDGSGLHVVARRASTLFGDQCYFEQAYNYLSIAETLLTAGADINLQNKSEGSTPLHEAVRYGQAETVAFFLSKGADVNIEDNENKRTPLHWAAAAGNMSIVQLLLEKGANPDAVDKCSNAPWMLAMQNKFDSVAQLLCSYLDVNAADINGRTPLHTACAAGCSQSVEVLLREGANFNAVDNAGNTPLIEAVQGKFEVVGRLLNCPNINIYHNNNQGLAAIHVAVNKLANTTRNMDLLGANTKYMYSRPVMRIVTLLIAKGADVNMLTGNGEALIVNHINNAVVFKCLVEAGANVNVITKDGDNTLKRAVMTDVSEENMEMTQTLLKANIDIEKLSRTMHNDATPLQYVIAAKKLDLVKLLIDSGAETSHLVAWIKNTESGRNVHDTLPEDIKTFIDQTANGGSCLMEMARSAVLRELGHRNVPYKIKQLMIPRSLQKFLTHELYLSWKRECV